MLHPSLALENWTATAAARSLASSFDWLGSNLNSRVQKQSDDVSVGQW